MASTSKLGRLVNRSTVLSNSKFLARLSSIRHHPAYLGKHVRSGSGSFHAANKYFQIMKALNHFGIVRRRRKIEITLNDKSNHDDKISPHLGYKKLDFRGDPSLDKCITYCKNRIKDINFNQLQNTSKKPFLINYPFDLSGTLHNEISQFACHPRLLSVITDYLGMLPVMAWATIWYSPNEDFHGRSQKYHIDGEDRRQVKCFVPLEAITEDCGPLTLLPADESRIIYDKLTKSKKIENFRNQKLDDELIYSVSKLQSGVPMVGEPGDVFLADTCSCYHYGSRPGAKPRVVLHLHYFTPFSVTMPWWGKKPKIDLGSLQLSEAEKNLRRQVLGLTHLDARNQKFH